ncbi:MAG: hypothetical protein COA86_17790 [Kangiella sp.]|nr:MAG: hypothetical protein COA86_17790 [Kangiella sp.]
MQIEQIDRLPFETTYYNAPLGNGEMGVQPLLWINGKSNKLPVSIEALVITSDLQGVSMPSENNNAQTLANEFIDTLLLMSEIGDLPGLDKILLILAGDLFASLTDNRRGLSGNIFPFLKRVADLKELQSLVVLGNHDQLESEEKEILDKHSNFHLLDNKTIDIGGVIFGGIDGVIGSNGKPNRVTPENYLKQIKKLKQQNTDVLILHEGPLIETENLLGNEFITNYLVHNSFPLVVSGHAHWNTISAKLSDSQILNVDSRVLVIHQN